MNSNVPCLASPVNRLKEEIFGLRSVVHFFFLCPAMFVVHQLGISDRSIPVWFVKSIQKPQTLSSQFSSVREEEGLSVS